MRRSALLATAWLGACGPAVAPGAGSVPVAAATAPTPATAADSALDAPATASRASAAVDPVDVAAAEPTAVTAPPESEAARDQATPPRDAEPIRDSEAPPLPAGTKVLHIGDSFAGALGIDLNRELAEAGVRGILKYQTATYIPTWASGKELGRYLEKYRPDLVLITLGANELEIPEPEQRARTIRKLVARVGATPCVWVGPPLWPGARPDLLDTIRASCAPCVYLDSTALVPDLPRTPDHIHPSMNARRTWARAVTAWLREHRAPDGEKPLSMVP